MTTVHPEATDGADLLERLNRLLQRRAAREIDDLGYRDELHGLLRTYRLQDIAACA